MTLPIQCPYHASLYASKVKKLAHRVRHPGNGRKALEREAADVARQCPSCTSQEKP